MRLKSQSQPAAQSDIALRFMRFLAADLERLEALMAHTGLGQQDFATRAEDPQFQAFLLDYGLENESLLLEFASNEALPPEAILRARRSLPGAAY